MKRKRWRRPNWWYLAWDFRRRNGRTVINRASVRWFGCSRTPKDTLKALVARGVRKVKPSYPLHFAVDCLETLEEVAIDYRNKFREMGGERLTLVPALNDDDRHAQVLAAIVENQLKGWV